MDQFLAAQIAVEEVQDRIATRRNLFEKAVMGRIDETLHYVARYLHDVFEDFEKGRVTRDGGRYVIGAEARNLRDFLLRLSVPDEVKHQRDIIADESQSYEKRHGALKCIVGLRKAGKGPRYARVAFASLHLTSSEPKHLIDAELR
jgi:hypothetical protein